MATYVMYYDGALEYTTYGSTRTANVSYYDGTTLVFSILPSLSKLDLSFTVTGIKERVFKSGSFATVKLLPTILTLEDECFMDCTNLKKVVLMHSSSDHITIGRDAFRNISPVSRLVYSGVDISSIKPNFLRVENTLSKFFPSPVVTLDRYHYVFYSISVDTPHLLQARIYDMENNLISSSTRTFTRHSAIEILKKSIRALNNLMIGNEEPGSFIDIAFVGVYEKSWNNKQSTNLMSYLNEKYSNVYKESIETFAVRVLSGGGTLLLNNKELPILVLKETGLYVFNQKHASNLNNPILFQGEMNTPYYKDGATTRLTLGNTSPELFYYTNSSNVLGKIINLTAVQHIKYVKVERNIFNQPFFSMSTNPNGPFERQPDLELKSNDGIYYFVTEHESNVNFPMSFGPNVESGYRILENTNWRDEALPPGSIGSFVFLDVPSNYPDQLFYFNGTVGGMNYVKPDPNTDVSYNVTVSDDILFIGDAAAPHLPLEYSKKYTFMQNDPSNTDRVILFADHYYSKNFMIENVVLMRDPGTEKSYTSVLVNNRDLLPTIFNNGNLYYYMANLNKTTLELQMDFDISCSIDIVLKDQEFTILISNNLSKDVSYNIGLDFGAGFVSGSPLAGTLMASSNTTLTYTSSSFGKLQLFIEDKLSLTRYIPHIYNLAFVDDLYVILDGINNNISSLETTEAGYYLFYQEDPTNQYHEFIVFTDPYTSLNNLFEDVFTSEVKSGNTGSYTMIYIANTTPVVNLYFWEERTWNSGFTFTILL
jgi:hypothetical protein